MPAETSSQAVRVARWIADRFEEDKLDYAIGGALALSVWSLPRATFDVDVSVFVPPARLDEVLDAIERAGGLVDRDDARARVDRVGLFVARVMGIRVDVYLACHPVHDSLFERRRTVELQGSQLYFLSAEDIALMKLIYHRPKDVIDLENLFATQQDALDIDYIRRWLERIVGSDDERLETLADLERRFIARP